LIKSLDYRGKLSSRNLWFDIKEEYDLANRLKAKKNKLPQEFQEQRERMHNANYKRKVERRAVKKLYRRYLSSIGYCQPKDSMIAITRFD